MEEKESFQSDMHINPEGHQGSEAITLFMAPSRSSIWGSKISLDPNHKARTSPSIIGSSLFQWPWTIPNASKRPILGLWTPWNPRIFGPRGAELVLGYSNSSHELLMAEHGPWTIGTSN
ncbi:hypothetical protein O181_099792 [Austropuccinia psidii MF-1]|uniref:Uncharacterized protein n=1 Tax=Austropuccinia psidii MF-1 TaxID=1389203 RepID=A0A9Q3PGW1_9BASI|nr:hypothetical protein [Austropuccinia psidii MF-1]